MPVCVCEGMLVCLVVSFESAASVFCVIAAAFTHPILIQFNKIFKTCFIYKTWQFAELYLNKYFIGLLVIRRVFTTCNWLLIFYVTSLFLIWWIGPSGLFPACEIPGSTEEREWGAPKLFASQGRSSERERERERKRVRERERRCLNTKNEKTEWK